MTAIHERLYVHSLKIHSEAPTQYTVGFNFVSRIKIMPCKTVENWHRQILIAVTFNLTKLIANFIVTEDHRINLLTTPVSFQREAGAQWEDLDFSPPLLPDDEEESSIIRGYEYPDVLDNEIGAL